MDKYLAAVISDTHGNKEALEAILSDIASKKRTLSKKGILIPVKYFFIGDAIGYGPNQIECLEKIREIADVYCIGNHELMAKIKIMHPKVRIPEASKNANSSLDLFVKELMGKKEIISASGKRIILPEENLEELQHSQYPKIIAKQIIRETLPKITANSPELKLFRKELSKEQMDQIGTQYLLQTITKYPEIYKEYQQRLKRREQILDIYNFFEEISKQKEYRLKNAILVHDNPVKPGDAKYLVDSKKAKELLIKRKNRAELSEIKKNKKKFSKIDYIIAGHSHAMPGITEINGIKLVYCGAGIPRLDNPERKTGYVMLLIENDKIKDVGPEIIGYDWRTTQRKIHKKGLHDPFGTK